jgi:hypothetical protein
MTDADALLGRLLLHMLRDTSLTIDGHDDDSVYTHLCGCPDATVTDSTGEDGGYGCETGCSYVKLTCEVSCPHHLGPFGASYGDFGELADLIADMEAEARR